MFSFYTPILLLQAFCVYHAYKNNAESRWYWFILIFSIFGCAFYLYDAFYSRGNINNITEKVKAVVNTNYHLEKLEKAYQFSDNVTNAVNLADAYVQYGHYDEALKLYMSVSTGFMAEDPGLKMKMLNAYFQNKNYSEAISIGKTLESEKVFSNAEQRIAYALAMHAAGSTDEAEKIFAGMDRPYTNYPHRLAYCKFLLDAGKKEEMQAKAAVLLEEFEYMKGPERKFYRGIMHEVRELQEASIKN